MEITISVLSLAYYGALFFTMVGALLGLMGVWIKNFWKSETAIKLLFTNLIFAATSTIVAAIVKWLS